MAVAQQASSLVVDDAAQQILPEIKSQKSSDISVAAEYQISEESKTAQERHEMSLQQVLLDRRAKSLAISTDDLEVRSWLKSLDHPVTLFGEREMRRRERLRALMAKLDEDGKLYDFLSSSHAICMGDDALGAESWSSNEEDEEKEAMKLSPFYTEGSQELLKARVEIARYSLLRAATRLAETKKNKSQDAKWDLVPRTMFSEMSMMCCQVGDPRPLHGCAFSRDGTLLATCAWSNLAKVWNVENMQERTLLRGHTERATSVAFSPTHDMLVTTSADRTTILWDLQGSIVKRFQGHRDCLARLAFHPSGAYLGTTSFDKTWRLWDIHTGTQLLLQEGHSRSVYGISFQRDGALVASCGLDALARVWDLRTGRSILALQGHVQPVHGLDFSPNGYHLATASMDGTCHVWDLRKCETLYTIPAHNSLISHVKYEPSNGYVLATASHDQTCKIWSGKDFKAIKTLKHHGHRFDRRWTIDGICIT